MRGLTSADSWFASLPSWLDISGAFDILKKLIGDRTVLLLETVMCLYITGEQVQGIRDTKKVKTFL